ncbi:MAG: hypothetical protein ACXVAU_01885, partial [Mucilaginibacter sp.]
MKLVIIFAAMFLVLGVGLTSCYKDVNIPTPAEDPNGPPQQWSFKKDIAPLLNTSCAKSGCHVAGSQAPDLETAVSYNSLVNGGYVNTVIP